MNSDVRGNIPNISNFHNNAGALSDFFQSQDVGNNSTLVNPNPTIPPPASNTNFTLPTHHTPSFAPNLVASSGNGINRNGLRLPAVDSNVQTNPPFALPTIGSGALQMGDVMNNGDLHSQNISSEMQSISAMDTRRNQLLLSLLRDRQLSNNNYHQDLGGGGT